MKKTAGEAPHPSYLQLDRYTLAAVTDQDASVGAHVRTCEACGAYVGGIAPTAIADATIREQAGTIPAWVRALAPREASGSRWLRLPGFTTLGFAAAATACAAVLWTAARRPPAQDDALPTPNVYLGSKGGPSVWLFVNHQQAVRVWNGSDPVTPGDLLRLKIQPDSFRHVSVFAATTAPPGYARLYEAPLGGKETALPVAWEVDAHPGDETLLVVLAPTAVAASDVAGLLAHGNTGGIWLRRFALPKRAAVNPR